MEKIDILIYIGSFIVAFLIGGISPSIMMSKAKGIDIKKEGSGNAGATNAFRVLGKKLGITVLLLDMLKGFIVSFVILLILGEFAGYFAALGVVFGHIFSVYNKFKAGKGVATTLGVLFAVNWIMGIICVVLALSLIIITRKVSIGSIAACVALPIVAWFLVPNFFVFSIILAAIVIYKHKTNIKRLFKGEEKKLW